MVDEIAGIILPINYQTSLADVYKRPKFMALKLPNKVIIWIWSGLSLEKDSGKSSVQKIFSKSF